jgi:NADPH:quinone reductase-like Zn-dependent oxidoreductase
VKQDVLVHDLDIIDVRRPRILTYRRRLQQQDYVAALEQTGLRPVIDRSFPLEQLADAFRFQESGGHFGKIAVEW